MLCRRKILAGIISLPFSAALAATSRDLAWAQGNSGGGNGGGNSGGNGGGNSGGGNGGGNSGGGNGGGNNGGGNGGGNSNNGNSGPADGGRGSKGNGNKGGGKGGRGSGRGGGATGGRSPADGGGKASVVTRGSTIEARHPNGMTERVRNGRYIMTDAKGRTIINRPARRSDRTRLQSLSD